MVQKSEPKKKNETQIDTTLNLQGYINSEYKFAQSTAEHLIVEQRKILNNYIHLCGFIYAAVFFIFYISIKEGLLDKADGNHVIFIILFLLFLVGIINVFKLLRIQRVWWNCNHIMNKIKDVYTTSIKEKKDIVQWTQDAIKHTFQEQYDQIFFLSALIIIILNSISLGIAAMIAEINFTIVISIIIVLVLSQMVYFRFK